jgi:hypothetical protein
MAYDFFKDLKWPTIDGSGGVPTPVLGTNDTSWINQGSVKKPTVATRPGFTTQDFLNQLMGDSEREATGLADMSSVLGSFSSGKKADRIVEGQFTGQFDRQAADNWQAYQDMLLKNNADRRLEESDALKKLTQSSYLANGGASQTPNIVSSMGRQMALPTYNFAPKAASPEEMQGASALRQTALDRLQSGPRAIPMPPSQHPLEGYAKPGTAEKIGSYGAVLTGMLGGLESATGGSLLGKIPGLSSIMGSGSAGAGSSAAGATGAVAGTAANAMGRYVVPGIGAVTGGIGLLKDRGTVGNLMNGVSAGSSIGTMIAPGIGTAAGAGIGALVGMLRGIGGGPSKNELAARETAKQLLGSLTSGASNQQRAEAQGAGWSNPDEALANIVLRDKVLAKGGSAADAENLMNSIFTARKKDPAAVQQAGLQINNLLNRG